MFFFRDPNGFVVTCSEAGIITEDKRGRIGAIFHLETKPTLGFLFVPFCKESLIEDWLDFFNIRMGWNVTPVKLIEVEWE